METAGSEQTSAVIMLWAKRVCTYVVGGRVGMDDTCYFTFDLKKLDHAPPTPPTQPAPPTQPTQPIQPVFGGCMQVQGMLPYLCSFLIYTSSSVLHQPRRNRCVFSCKMRLGYMSLPPNREKSLCFLMQNAAGLHFDCKFTCHSRPPRRNRSVSGKKKNAWASF